MPAINKAEIPFALLLLPFLVGLCLAAYFPLAGRTELFFALFFVAMALFIGLNLAYQKLHIYKNRWLGGALVHVILLIAGIICFNNNREIDRAIFGIPKEGVGFSRDARIHMGPPKWAEAVFHHDGAQVIHFALRYFMGPSGPEAWVKAHK